MGRKTEDDIEELDLEDEESETEEQDEDDRGDEADPDATEENLKAVAEEEEEEEEKPKKSSAVPHARFNEVNEQLKAEREARLRLEEELARARGSAAKDEKKADDKPAFDLDAKEGEYLDAMIEGDKDKAMAIRKQINAYLRAEAEEAASAKAEERVLERQARQQFADAVSAVIEDYPFLDSKSADKNDEAIEEVVALRNLYMSRNMPAHEALLKAAEKIGPRYAKAKDDDEEEKTVKKSKIDDLRAARLKRNALASKAQPPALSGTGVGARSEAAKLKLEELSEEEFEKLPAAKKRELRGDVI